MATRTPRLLRSSSTPATHSTSLMARLSVISKQIWLGSTPVRVRMSDTSSTNRDCMN
jgi:hypothetical protein